MRLYLPILILFSAYYPATGQRTIPKTDTIHIANPGNPLDPFFLNRDSTLAEKVVAFAQSLSGTPYRFGCSAPDVGFDCSGFINYVFNHFGITVPRSSVDFTNEGIPVDIEQSMPGDLILFTGTNNKIRIVGHIGIIVSNDNTGISFIHSSSGSDYKVITTKLGDYYKGRFVKVIRMGW